MEYLNYLLLLQFSCSILSLLRAGLLLNVLIVYKFLMFLFVLVAALAPGSVVRSSRQVVRHSFVRPPLGSTGFTLNYKLIIPPFLSTNFCYLFFSITPIYGDTVVEKRIVKIIPSGVKWISWIQVGPGHSSASRMKVQCTLFSQVI